MIIHDLDGEEGQLVVRYNCHDCCDQPTIKVGIDVSKVLYSMKYIKAPPFLLMTISFSINDCCDKGGCNINNLTSVLERWPSG